jgi:hypothetical protein
MVAASVLVAGSVGWAGGVDAQSAAGPAAGKQSAAKNSETAADKKAGAVKQDAAAAQKFVEAGIAALEAGNIDNAITNLSSGISSGSLPGVQMARALYYRGVAYRKQGKPALAIADLTSALWLRGGLTGSLRQEAMQNRAAAYREAGLPDQSEADAVRASARATASADNEAKSASRVETGAVAPAAGDTPKSTAELTSSGSSFSGIDNFFSSLFGSSAPAPAAAAPPPPSPPTAATSSWRNGTEVNHPAPLKAWAETTTSSISAAAPASARPEPTANKVIGPATGRYRLQVAAVRSQAEAQAVAARMRQRHGPDIAALQTEIDETVVGNMGTLYRVRVGPFADANAPLALCAKLKRDGLDCLIVTQ